MSVTEQHLAPGQWSLRLSAGTPSHIYDALKFYGHIMVFPQWFDVDTYDDTGLKSLSAYTGIVKNISIEDDGSITLGGVSIAGWLGDSGGNRGWIYQKERFYDLDLLTNVLTRTASEPYGLFYRNASNLISLTPGTITDASLQNCTGETADDTIDLTAHGYKNKDIVKFATLTGGSSLSTDTAYYVINKAANTFQISDTEGGSALDFGSDITAATITNALYTGVHIYQTPRQALEYCLGLWGQIAGLNMEYKVNPDGTVDIGRRSDLFVTQPQTIIHRGVGFSPEYRQAPVERIAANLDAEDYATKVLIMAGGYGFDQVHVAAANQSSYPSNVEQTNFIGQNNTIKAMVSEDFTTEAKAEKRAKKAVTELSKIHQNLTIDTANYDISGGDYKVGDYVYVYDPQAGVVDTSNEVYFEGHLIYPKKLRMLSNTWGFAEGMGVFYRSSTPTYYDLSRYIVWEERASANATSNFRSKSIPTPKLDF